MLSLWTMKPFARPFGAGIHTAAWCTFISFSKDSTSRERSRRTSTTAYHSHKVESRTWCVCSIL